VTNKYAPRIECKKCSKIFWDYNEEKEIAKCSHCKEKHTKILHPLIGAEISKNDSGNFVLYFPKFGETDIYSRWEDLDKKLNELAKNEVDTNE